MQEFHCPRCGGWAFGRDVYTDDVYCHSNTEGRPLTEGGKPCGWKSPPFGPAKKIVNSGVGINPEFPLVLFELLECGHLQRPVEDMIGRTNAARRRCKKCRRGTPLDITL